jgi:hypothetical protein
MRPVWRLLEMVAICSLALCAWLTLAFLLIHQAKPRPFVWPAPLCHISEETNIDGTIYFDGAYVPCKWLKQEISV